MILSSANELHLHKKGQEVITIKNLYFSYHGVPPYILEDLNLEIRNGEYISVVGDNGSGKSTLIRLLLQFIRPTRGSILTEADRIGYVPQKNDYTNSGFPITVLEVLDSYRHLLRQKDKTVVWAALEQMGMTAYAHALMGTLSGGQSQKIMIARALMGDPELLVLDEPSTGVDVESQKEIYSFLKQINQERGITMISVEHNLEAAITNSTLIYHMSGGHGHLCTPEHYAAELLKKGIGTNYAVL